MLVYIMSPDWLSGVFTRLKVSDTAPGWKQSETEPLRKYVIPVFLKEFPSL